MGKVYDALQRAEEQRARSSGEAMAAGGGFALPPEGAHRKPARRAHWLRWLARTAPALEDASALNKRRISLLQPQSFVSEQFRTLRARIEHLASAGPLRSIAVTSADPGDGKSMTAINLALVMSMGVGRKVVLVDCDLRKPRVHHSLGLQVDTGLAEVLAGAADLEAALVPVEGSTLQVLPVRSLPSNPAELLASGAMRELVEKLMARCDWVILDVPPTLGLPDAKVVTGLCDAILFVVRAHATPREDIEAALEILDRSRVLGIVLNEADAEPERYGYPG